MLLTNRLHKIIQTKWQIRELNYGLSVLDNVWEYMALCQRQTMIQIQTEPVLHHLWDSHLIVSNLVLNTVKLYILVTCGMWGICRHSNSYVCKSTPLLSVIDWTCFKLKRGHCVTQKYVHTGSKGSGDGHYHFYNSGHWTTIL